MPRVEIKQRYAAEAQNSWDLPDEDGVYDLPNGGTIAVEMNPKDKETTAEGLQYIALTSLLFKGHERRITGGELTYFGEERRFVLIGKKGSGSIQLSSHDILKVTLNSALQGGK